MISIRQSDTSIVICNVGKCQHITFIGWELFLKFPHPDFHSPVGTDFTESVKKFQVFLCDFKSDINLYILFFFIKISFCNLVLPAYCAERAENCCFSPFCTDSLVLAAPVTPEYLELADTLKKDEPVTLQHFLSHPFILRANGSGTRKEIDLFLERHQISLSELNIVARMNDLESIKKSIASGLGISILSARSVKDMERTHQLLTFPLENAAQVRTFYIVYNKNRILKPYVKQFLKFVEHFYK